MSDTERRPSSDPADLHRETPLDGKVALVTGASSGIGRALAQMLAAEGARLALAARSEARLASVRASVEPAEALVVPVDLADPAQVERMVEAVSARYGAVDVFCANAGLYVPGEVIEGDPGAWEEMIAVNVASVFRAIRRVLPAMVERGSGHIVVTSSISGHAALHWEPVYSATKHAIQTFVHGLRRQVAPHGIRVGEVSPGIVLNELWGIHDTAEITRRAALHEGLLSRDIADAVRFMLTRPAHVTVRDMVVLPQNQDI